MTFDSAYFDNLRHILNHTMYIFLICRLGGDMPRYRGNQASKPGPGSKAESGGGGGGEKKRKKQKDSDEEDMTSSNGVSGNDEPKYTRAAHSTNARRGPPHHRQHGRHAAHISNYYKKFVTETI